MKNSVIGLLIIGIALASVSIYFGIHFNNNKDDLEYELAGEGDSDLGVAIGTGVVALILFGSAYYLHTRKD